MTGTQEDGYAPVVFEQKPVHVRLDLSDARRIYAFGDVHGNIDPIRDAMKKAGYSARDGDRMIGLGDWLDRGQHTTKIAKFIEEHADDLHFVKGNHEQMLEDAVRPREGGIDGVNLIRNGGGWLLERMRQEDDEDTDGEGRLLLDAKGRRIVKAVCGAPVAMTVITPARYRIGIVHSEVRRMFGRLDWEAFVGTLEQQGPHGFIAEDAMWERDEIRRIKHEHADGKRARQSDHVENIDHVFHGHTILKEPLVWGNRSWIDVASYKRGSAAFVDVDEWTSRNATKKGK